MGNSSTLISEEVKIIMDYLDSGKSLFISSKHLGTEYNGAIFYRYYLWSALVGYSDVLVVNATSSSIYSGSYILYGKDSANNSRLSEYIRALDYAYPLLVYNETNIAAIAVDTVYRVVYFAFLFESINSTQARREIMNATINFLNTSKGKPTRIEATSYTVEYATEISINATIYAEDSILAGANVSIYIKLNGYWILLGSAISNTNGIISMPLNASYDPGRYMLAFVFPGNSTFSKAVSIVYLYITRRPSELKILSDTTIPDAGAEIVFNVTTNGKPYSTEVVIYVEGFLFCGTSDKNGVAKIFVSLPPGQYRAKALSMETKYIMSTYINFSLEVYDDDTEPPTIEVFPINSSPYYKDLTIRALIRDPSGVYSAVIHYNTTIASGTVSMEYTDGYWVGTIPKEVLAYGSVRWYISASDADSDWLGDKAEGKTIVYTTEIIDDKPPQIYGYSIEPRIVYVGEPAVIWAIIEEPERASGISIVKLRILQGNKTLSEYNMSFDGLRYASSIIMREAGNYTAEITAKDNAGNEAKISFTFTVIGRSILKVQLPAYLITYIASGLIIVLIAGVSVYIIKSRGIKIKEPEQ